MHTTQLMWFSWRWTYPNDFAEKDVISLGTVWKKVRGQNYATMDKKERWTSSCVMSAPWILFWAYRGAGPEKII